jgi:hypothetical protein
MKSIDAVGGGHDDETFGAQTLGERQRKARFVLDEEKLHVPASPISVLPQ